MDRCGEVSGRTVQMDINFGGSWEEIRKIWSESYARGTERRGQSSELSEEV